ncbi:uncharacterized protein LOC101848486 [Aplysia californica]|uniref:Uncharacterized protein LOC101848486 n=1 Tax=Aplysia californica TaxID=6500 RepID=A0ABM1W3P8_APLCA|nr:uncharacterized protein LOC101848486 [Aplysia californica]
MSSGSFLLFENFDFENNSSFQAGWKAISKVVDPTKLESELLRAKAFFFSKHVCQFDFDKYLLWKESKPKRNQTSEGQASSAEPPRADCDVVQSTRRQVDKVIESKSLFEKEDIAQPNLCVSEGECSLDKTDGHSLVDGIRDGTKDEGNLVSESVTGRTDVDNVKSEVDETVTGDENEEQKELSLAELAEMIQNNVPIPGVVAVDVQPTNSEPTPSVMARKLKPWEVGVTSSEGDDSVQRLSSLSLSSDR